MNEVDETIGADGEDLNAAATPVRPAGASVAVRLARRAVVGRLGQLARGRLRIRDHLGSVQLGGNPGPELPDVRLHITDLSAWLDFATGGSIGAAEAYMQGKWRTDQLAGLVRLLLLNRPVLDQLDGGLVRLGNPLLRLAHWFHRNTRRGSRRNIRAHYDLGDELFELFLDPTMTYSAAIYPRDDATLEEAAVHKLDQVCRKLGLTPDDHLLEIGTGWGGLALHAARHYGCRVTTTTISARQFAYATDLIRAAGLAERVTVVGQDYRDLRGQYDKLVSIEMIEAVGLRFLDTYFRVCSERLKPAGRMLLQAIVIADRYHVRASRSVDFIQKYIFPGGALPSVGAIMTSVARMTDLQLTGLQEIGLDYARTLRDWRQRFLARLPDVRRLGYPDEFIRMWEWYLAYCEGGFLERAIGDVQLVFDKPDCRLPPVGALA